MNTDKLNLDHRAMVKCLAKNGMEVVKDLTPLNAHLWHMATGVAGEAGELLDAVKKLAIYARPMDPKVRAHIIEELGDLEFYMAGLRDELSIERDETLQANMDKLAVRYKNYKYTNEAAQTRADKEPGQ